MHVSPCFRVNVGDTVEVRAVAVVASSRSSFVCRRFVASSRPVASHRPRRASQVGQCRPLSKTVRFNVVKIIKSQSNKKFKKF